MLIAINAQLNETVIQAIVLKSITNILTKQIIVNANHNIVITNSHHQLNLFSLIDNANIILFQTVIINKNTVKNILISAVANEIPLIIDTACSEPNKTPQTIKSTPIQIETIPSAHKYFLWHL